MTEVALLSEGPSRPAPRPRRDEPPRLGRLADLGLIGAILGLTALLGVFPLKDTDFWWHLRTGDLIRQTGKLPTVDTYTFGAAGHRWVDLHWIFQILISHGHAAVGIAGLNAAKCLVTALAVGLLITARRKDWPVWVMVVAWLPALLILAGRMYLRPETLTLLYLSAYLAILFRVEERPRLAFLLPIVQAAWVNSQGLFVLGPIVLGCLWIDAACRPGSFEAGRLRWWRTLGIATVLVGFACVVNPYGLAGALYPIQLAGTMANPIFSRSIGELKPVQVFIRESGLTNPFMMLYLGSIVLAVLSFVVPIAWRVADRASRGRAEPEPAPMKKGKARRRKAGAAAGPESVRPSLFRLLLLCGFTYLSWQATRNSHQFAAIVGTITAWNLGEWAAEVNRSRAARGVVASPGRGRAVAFAAVAALFVATATGALYAWEGEGRTVGLGEEPHWFPHAAVGFAGRPDMPARSICFHDGHAAYYEYRYAPERKTYTDARLEVAGPALYSEYMALSRKVAENRPGWEAEFEAMGRPAVIVDNVHPAFSRQAATMLASPRYRCVWFDEVAGVYVHESYAGVVAAHAIDFAARHFDPSRTAGTDPGVERQLLKAIENIAFGLVPQPDASTRPGWRDLSRKLIWTGLDHARALRAIDPTSLDGWKWAGMLETLREINASRESIPRYRMAFDPVYDLSDVRAAHDLRRALEIAPEDGNVLIALSELDRRRGMLASAADLIGRFLDRPATQEAERSRQEMLAPERATLLARVGDPPPSLAWKNLSELDRLLTYLYNHGRAAEAADLLESAFPEDGRTWENADRVATIRLHLGEADRARAIWASAKSPPSEALRQARVAAAWLAAGDLDRAIESYRSAASSDPNLFEAQFGLAVAEADLGRAPEALAAAQASLKSVPHAAAGSAVDRLIGAVSPYAK